MLSSSLLAFGFLCLSSCFLYSDSLSAMARASISSSSSSRLTCAVRLLLFRKKYNKHAFVLFIHIHDGFHGHLRKKVNIYLFAVASAPELSSLDIRRAYSKASLSLYFKLKINTIKTNICHHS